ncbi:GAF sensor signal transduction histidine kinase [Calothrix sp. NIES-4071]|nr:GAF sensor signal transduction histidine kinase [Calothrix sp. NIES-4071]BAZ57869.1 GAF sensor signal transduction histidine kinase [Calothrix sp. NIES-4105]
MRFCNEFTPNTPIAIAILETENDALRFELTNCRQASERAAELQKRVEALSIEVAERKRAQQIARGQTEVLNRTLQILTTNPELDQFLRQVLVVITEQLDVPSCTVWLYNSTENIYLLHMTCSEGKIATGRQQFGHPSASTPLQAQDKAWVTSYLNYQTVICDDVANEPRFPPAVREYLHSLGVKMLLSVPLIIDGEVIGVLNIRNTKRVFTQEEIELAHALANQATLALQLTRLAEQAKQSAVLEERSRLASEIHDTLAQVFTGVSIQLGVAARIADLQPEKAWEIIEQVNKLAQAGLAETRRFIWDFYPPAAEYADLVRSLRSSVEQITCGSKEHIEFTITGTPYLLPSVIGMNLLRIGQEALTNSLKHAQAETIWIKLVYDPEYVYLYVRDNGQGFMLQPDSDGFGLIGMHRRAERIGCQLSICSQIGQGTEIIVRAFQLEPKSGKKL